MDGLLAPGLQLLGKLRVVRLLGAGGLGAVYEVEHELTLHRRALKLLHPRFRTDADVIGRFVREASAAGRIGNPHIVETFDAGELPSGEPFLLMELLQGQPLSSLIREQGRLSAGLATELLSQAAEAVDAAHRAGIVHRDLKPDNLFVVQRDGRPFLKVLDFGISKFDSRHTGALTMTTPGMAMGTPVYMAPEQMRGAHEVDARADVYSLGVVLYEALSSALPYQAESFAQLAALVLGGNAPPLAERCPGLSPALVTVVHQAMALAPGARFASAAAFSAALTPFRRLDEPVAAKAGPVEDLGDTLVRATPAVALEGTQVRATPAAAHVAAGLAVDGLEGTLVRATPAAANVANGLVPAASANVAAGPVANSLVPAASANGAVGPMDNGVVPPAANVAAGPLTNGLVPAASASVAAGPVANGLVPAAANVAAGPLTNGLVPAAAANGAAGPVAAASAADRLPGIPAAPRSSRGVGVAVLLGALLLGVGVVIKSVMGGPAPTVSAPLVTPPAQPEPAPVAAPSVESAPQKTPIAAPSAESPPPQKPPVAATSVDSPPSTVPARPAPSSIPRTRSAAPKTKPDAGTPGGLVNDINEGT